MARRRSRGHGRRFGRHRPSASSVGRVEGSAGPTVAGGAGSADSVAPVSRRIAIHSRPVARRTARRPPAFRRRAGYQAWNPPPGALEAESRVESASPASGFSGSTASIAVRSRSCRASPLPSRPCPARRSLRGSPADAPPRPPRGGRPPEAFHPVERKSSTTAIAASISMAVTSPTSRTNSASRDRASIVAILASRASSAEDRAARSRSNCSAC